MKTINKYNIRYCLFLSFCFFFIVTVSFAQNSADEDSLKIAKNYLYGKGVEQNYIKAYKIYFQLAKEGNTYALNALGIMRQNGLGVDKNDTLALKYFFMSAKKGNGKAAYNIGVIYKEGDGFGQNFERAFRWFEVAERLGYSKGYYGTGYAYHKGLGVEQSYEKAAGEFLKGAEKGDAFCMYFLALCYRTGSGVEKNQDQFNFWLNQSAEKGSGKAQNLLNKIKEGSSTQQVNLIYTPVNIEPENVEFNIENLKAYRRAKDLSSYEGTWNGTLYTLDWSGKQILTTDRLKLELNTQGDRIFGKWIENDTISAPIEGVLIDSLIVFENTEISKNYQRKLDKLQLEKASFKLNTETIGKNFLLGNLSFYSTIQKEPYRPNVIQLEKVISQNTGINGIENNRFAVYPNPFVDNLYLDCQVDKEQNITIEIYNTSGKLIDKQVQKLVVGNNKLLLSNAHFASGVYFLQITGDDLLYSTSVIKK